MDCNRECWSTRVPGRKLRGGRGGIEHKVLLQGRIGELAVDFGGIWSQWLLGRGREEP